MIPAVVLGLVFHDTIKSLFNPINVMYALVVGGFLLIAAEVLKPKTPRAEGLDDMTYRRLYHWLLPVSGAVAGLLPFRSNDFRRDADGCKPLRGI